MKAKVNVPTKNKFFKAIIYPLRTLLSKLFYMDRKQELPTVTKSISVSTDDSLPPEHLNKLIGGGDFKEIGDVFLSYFINLGGVKSTDRILDVGCGVGRMAVPLIGYLDPEGCYEGFDIVKESIDWCDTKITPLHPNFRFRVIDVFNKLYNLAGKYKGSEYIFPFEDNSFDFIFLTSVFTHMLPDEMEQYLSEISRVLKMKGRCLITYFLLNETSSNHILKAQSKLLFNYKLGNCQVEDANVPEAVVSYNEAFVRKLFIKYDLSMESPIQYGSWSGRKDFLSFQDIIVATKKSKLA
jgi:ubiquinone/menaquinone biosynthesis C-methylase UbiE